MKVNKRGLMKEKIIVGLICILLISLVCAGAAEARSGSGLDVIASGDLVFVGEENLDVSAVMSAEYNNQLRTEDGSRYIDVSGGKIAEVPAVSGENYPYKFYPYNGSKPDGSRYDMSRYILVSDLNSVLDGIYLNKTVSNKEIKAEGADIINTEVVQYYIKVKGTYSTEFAQFITDVSSVVPDWYKFYYIADGVVMPFNSVTDTAGILVKILQGDPTNPANAAQFTYYANDMKTGLHSVKYSFILNIPTIKTSDDADKPQINAVHSVRESSAADFSITGANTVNPGESVDITLKGTALTTYNLTISPQSYITFNKGISTPSGSIERIDDYNLRVTFGEDSDKEILYRVTADENAKPGEYYIYMSDEKNNRKSLLITINKLDRIPTIEISNDVKNGKFSSGDTIRIDVTYENPKNGETADLILKPQNGAEQILLPGLTFKNGKDARLPYNLQTRGFDAGTYELILRTTEGSEGKTAFYLGTPTIIASIYGGYNTVLVTGDELELEWYARGSPGINLATDTIGTVRWYILGTNFAQAGTKSFEITGGTVGESVPEGHSTYIYDEEFTANLSAGAYSLIMEHPGADNIFAFTPDTYFAPLSTITTEWGDTISISSRQTPNTAAMLMELLNGVKSDDLAVMLTFQVEQPWFTLTDISSVKLGGDVIISGETNYPADKTVALTIYPASFAPSGAQNNAMSMTAYAEGKTKDEGEYNKRSFELTITGTDSWYPGTYVGCFSLPDREIVRSVSFIVGADGDITSPDITIDESLPAAYDYTGAAAAPEPTPTPLPQPATLPVPTATPAPKNCVPLFGAIAAFAAAAVILRRRQ
ncbi:MAG TPA: hypothetical protein O0X97_03815 [Methanocorpusculum sp.]|nr:hypothetical protein [Methanocorpusculum sp.]